MLGVCVAAYRVDAAVAVVLELALAVCAGLCREGTGEEDETEADDGDHFGCWYGGIGMIGVGLEGGCELSWASCWMMPQST